MGNVGDLPMHSLFWLRGRGPGWRLVWLQGWFFGVVGFLGFVGIGRAALAPAARPNVIVILADDMGIGDVSSLNAKCAWKTPGIDRLAREGRTFTDAHSASGVCTPSRYTLLTGRYSWRGKLKSSVLHGYDPALIEPGRLTVAGFFAGSGVCDGHGGEVALGCGLGADGAQIRGGRFCSILRRWADLSGV